MDFRAGAINRFDAFGDPTPDRSPRVPFRPGRRRVRLAMRLGCGMARLRRQFVDGAWGSL